MKRFAFWFVIGLVAIAVVKARREERRERLATIVVHQVSEPDPDTESRTARYRVEGEGRRIYTLKQLSKKFRHAQIVEIDDHESEADDNDDDQDDDNGRGRIARNDHHKVRVEGLPVAVIPGTRIIMADSRPLPPAAPEVPAIPATPESTADFMVSIDEHGEIQKARPEPIKTVSGRLSATEDRAKADARVQLVGVIRSRLEGKLPSDWTIPETLLDPMIEKVDIKTKDHPFGTLYEAVLTIDSHPIALQRIVNVHHREMVIKRLTLLGGGLGFVLLCLGALSGYIKADEATKGYYTNPLRLASAAGVGAGGVLLYQMLSGKI